MLLDKQILEFVRNEQYDKLTIADISYILENANIKYYNTNKTIMTDAQYDKLKDYLKQIDPDNEYLKVIGAPINKDRQKVKLPFKMGSLDKIKEEKFIKNWTKKYKGNYVVSDKLDGASAQLYIDAKNNAKLYSRGDGFEGQDISHLIPYFFNKKTLSEIPSETSIRGEIIISKKNFEKIADENKNARNTVSGLINTKKNKENKEIANLSEFVAYTILEPEMTQEEQMKELKKYKLNVVEWKIFDELNEKILGEYLTQRRAISKYEMDGVVCIDNSKSYAHKSGNPDHGFAFKMEFDDQFAITTVEEVQWNPSKDGLLKPRIKIKKVNLVGTTIEYATAFNAKFIFENKIGKGSKIKIIRSGDVIPYIKEVLSTSTSGKPDMPKFEYEWNDTEVDITAKIMTNDIKQIITIKVITGFFEKMKVKFISEGIITKLVENGFDTIPKILNATKKDLIKIDGIGEKIVDKIYNEINNAFDTVDLHVFMGASHMFGRGFGVKKIKEVTDVYPNILSLDVSNDDLIDMITEIKGFSDKTANQFVDNLERFKNFYNEISKIKDLSRFENVKKNKKQQKLIFNDMKFVFTGFRDSDLEHEIEKMGGKVSTSVSSKTDYVIHADDTDLSSSKMIKAKELNLNIISKSEFIKKFKLI